MLKLKHISLATLIASNLAFSVAIADPDANPPPTSTSESKELDRTHCEKHWGDKAKRVEDALTKLHTALNLTPKQEKDWAAWAQNFEVNPDEWKERHKEWDSTETLTVIQRLEKKLEHSKEHEKKIKTKLSATKKFYSKLTADQKKIFDTEFDLWKHHHHDKGGEQT